jgi:hypothetical protein
MGIFQDLMGNIFQGAPAASAPPAPGATSDNASQPAPRAAPAAAQPAATIDIAAILDRMASESKQKLDWKHSIVDLMKALDIDSSLSARKELAKELGYTGDTNDSASMNIWLHKQVMSKLAANGGKLPPEIKH